MLGQNSMFGYIVNHCNGNFVIKKSLIEFCYFLYKPFCVLSSFYSKFKSSEKFLYSPPQSYCTDHAENKENSKCPVFFQHPLLLNCWHLYSRHCKVEASSDTFSQFFNKTFFKSIIYLKLIKQ